MTWQGLAVLALGMVVGTAMLGLGVLLGRMWSRSESQAAVSEAQSLMTAARAVSDMTVTLADSSIREAALGTRMDGLNRALDALTTATAAWESQLSRNTDNLTMLVDAFIQRGYLREVRLPAQVGERSRPAPASPNLVPNAQEDGSRSHTEPTATG